MQSVQFSSSKAASGYRILIADDDTDTAMLLKYLLNEQGAQVTLVPNGQQCYESALQALMQGRPFHVILMDLAMPVCDGIKATRLLRESGYSLPIIAMTARFTLQDKKEATEAGCNSFINKLDGSAELVRAITSQYKTRSMDTQIIELPLLPLVPSALKENPDYCGPALGFLDKLPAALIGISEAVQSKDYSKLKSACLALGAASLYGYRVFGEYLKELLKAANSKSDREIDKILTAFERTAQQMIAGREMVRKLQNPAHGDKTGAA